MTSTGHRPFKHLRTWRTAAARHPAPAPRPNFSKGLAAFAGVAVCFLSADLLATSAAAQAPDEPRLWSSLVVNAPIDERLLLKADALMETQSGSSTGLGLVRFVILRQATERLAFGGGYAWVHGPTTPGPAYSEHRAVQDLNLVLADAAEGPRLTSRTRLEERLRESHSGVAVRLRQQTRLEVPLPRTSVRAVFWNEYFHTLRDTGWSGPAGPGLLLSFIGARIPVTDGLVLEPGYLNQVAFGPERTRITHIAAITATIGF